MKSSFSSVTNKKESGQIFFYSTVDRLTVNSRNNQFMFVRQILVIYVYYVARGVLFIDTSM